MLTKERFTKLAQEYMDMVFRLAFSRLKNRADADDATQNVLLALYRSDVCFESGEHVKNWLVRVTLNECRKHWRSPWARMEALEESASDPLWENDKSRELFYAIMALEKKYRTVIVLHYYEGFSVSEIAGFLGVPPGTVGTWLSRARHKLKEYLTEVE